MSDKKDSAKKTTVPQGTEQLFSENAPTSTLEAKDSSFNFEQAEGELFGGSYARLELEPGDVSIPLVYRKDTEIPLPDQDANGNETTKMQTVYVCELPNTELVTCPISAIFMKHFKEAKIVKGDEFRIKRYPNAVKKRGKGAGNQMQVFAVRVTKRAATEN